MQLPRILAVVTLSVCLATVCAIEGKASTVPAPIAIGGSIAFADANAKQRFDAYVAFLVLDPAKYAQEIETIERLSRSDVTYEVSVDAALPPGVHGSLSTDGERVHVNVSSNAGCCGQIASLNSRFAHEFEHARQFDAGELAFVYHPRAGEWIPSPSCYDIGDEVKAWAAQLRASAPGDFWVTSAGVRRPTLLRRFADARTDEERAQVLAKSGYSDRNPRLNSNLNFADGPYREGDLVRRLGPGALFGRVYGVGMPADVARGGSAGEASGAGTSVRDAMDAAVSPSVSDDPRRR